ncbi:DUF4328 domain-containing protein [Streptomyces mangrovisoli]|uniref:DUF4328 domain-containing protein n=1 Tax=Streptomyces mangrovisoli TaxID=1428628 RepID=A0A1J4P4D0_9ACTN|nr:DUF4328 domain-containing protein [Streptomyces mangrovisoli]OIJ69607.1 hypothetical protein WN71_001650 [Streptomyces mangrovisoli]
MTRRTASPGALAWWTCGALAACVLLTVAAHLAGRHKYEMLRAAARTHSLGGEPRVRADMWFGNLTGWLQASTALAVVLFVFWLRRTRALAELVWPEARRPRRTWRIPAWLLAPAWLFLLPMTSVNELWAATEPEERRRPATPLLVVWWLCVLATAYRTTAGAPALKRAMTAPAALDALHRLLLSDGLRVAAATTTAIVVLRLSGRLDAAVRALPCSPSAPHPTGAPAAARSTGS